MLKSFKTFIAIGLLAGVCMTSVEAGTEVEQPTSRMQKFKNGLNKHLDKAKEHAVKLHGDAKEHFNKAKEKIGALQAQASEHFSNAQDDLEKKFEELSAKIEDQYEKMEDMATEKANGFAGKAKDLGGKAVTKAKEFKGRFTKQPVASEGEELGEDEAGN